MLGQSVVGILKERPAVSAIRTLDEIANKNGRDSTFVLSSFSFFRHSDRTKSEKTGQFLEGKTALLGLITVRPEDDHVECPES